MAFETEADKSARIVELEAEETALTAAILNAIKVRNMQSPGGYGKANQSLKELVAMRKDVRKSLSTLKGLKTGISYGNPISR